VYIYVENEYKNYTNIPNSKKQQIMLS